MSSKNRGDRIQLLQKVVSKHFTPVLAPKDRNILEHLIYASCLEDAPYDLADEAFHRLQAFFVDWNEVRVTTVTELVEHFSKLPEPAAAATRVKKNLQSIFETRYSFDIEELQKMNQGKAIAELEKFGGMSKFVLNYVTQNAFGGHAIPVSKTIVEVLVATEIMTENEAEKGQIANLERTVTKTKGPEFASCLHQLGLLLASSPNGKNTKAILKEAGAPEKKEKSKEEKAKEASAAKTAAAKSDKAVPGKSESAKPEVTKSGPSKPEQTKPGTAKSEPAKTGAAKIEPKVEAAKKVVPPQKAPPAPAKTTPAKKATPPKKATEKPIEKPAGKKTTPPKKPATKGSPAPTKRKPK